jgi:hypothetical protein
MNSLISISIISHRQMSLVRQLLADLQTYCPAANIEIILTLNVPEAFDFDAASLPFPFLCIDNPASKGFGANHNAAFRLAKGDFFCVLNPDIRLTRNPFPPLVALAEQERVGVVAPRIFNGEGDREDSARCFPTPRELLGKFFGGKSAAVPDTVGVCAPDWVAGMFMFFPAAVFREMKGFDERYFLYYEDVDLCARLALAGYKRLVCPDVRVVHEARRSSHRDVRYAVMHLQSILRFFSSDVYRRARALQRS